jgi:hypothetical protein
MHQAWKHLQSELGTLQVSSEGPVLWLKVQAAKNVWQLHRRLNPPSKPLMKLPLLEGR